MDRLKDFLERGSIFSTETQVQVSLIKKQKLIYRVENGKQRAWGFYRISEFEYSYPNNREPFIVIGPQNNFRKKKNSKSDLGLLGDL